MNGVIKTLKFTDSKGEKYNVYPRTLIECISNKNGDTLEDTLNKYIEENVKDVVIDVVGDTYATKESVTNITNGTTTVGKATADAAGNVIADTYASKTYVAEQIAATDHLTREIVTSIPTANTAEDNVLYLYKADDETDNVYQEYQLINGEIALVGGVKIDLSDYVKSEELDRLLENLSKTIPTKVSDLDNDAGYVTTDTNTTYTLAKENDTVTFTGSDGYTYSFEVGKNITLSDLGINVTADEINKLDGVTNNIQSDISTLTTHSNDTNVHVTSEDKTAWNKNTTDIVTLTEHSTNADVHVTTEDKEAWNKNTTDITNITNGTTTVPVATKATNDGNGNIISETYAKVTDVESDISGLQTQIDNKVPDTRTVNGKALNADVTLTAGDVGADASGSAAQALADAKAYTDTEIASTKTYAETQAASALADAKTYNDTAYANANAYTDTKISELINGAPTTLDTLKEIADAMAEHEDVVEALNDAIGTKANQTELDTHTGNNTIHITADERTTWNNAVPNTGGNITGNVNLVGDSSSSRVLRITNDTRYIDTMINPDGSYQVYDGTNSKEIITSSAEGVNTFYGTATYASKLNGSYGADVGMNASPGANCVRYISSISADTEGLFPHSSNANSILTLNRHEGDFNSQLGFSSDSNVYYRHSTSADWKTILDSSNYSNYALPVIGGSTSGNIGVIRDTLAAFIVNNNNRQARFAAEGNNVGIYDVNNNKWLIVSGGDGNTTINGTATGNLPIDNDGIVNQIIIFRNADNGRAMLFKNNSSTADYGTILRDVTSDSKSVDLQLCASRDTLKFTDTSGNINDILHTGNYTDYVLPKSGGGTLTAVEGSNTALTVKGSTTEGTSWIRFNDKNNTQLGYLGFDSVNNPTFLNADGATGSVILHSRNYYNYALPLSGGTITGNLYLSNGNSDTKTQIFQYDSQSVFRNITDTSNYQEVIIGADTLKYQTVTDGTVSTNQLLHSGNYSSYALPKTGGTVNGDIILSSSKAENRYIQFVNNARNISCMVLADGGFTIYDNTNNNSIINSTSNGTNAFIGTATGNLPVTGGELSGNLVVYGTGEVTRQISLQNTNRRVYQCVQPGGTYFLYDATNNTEIIRSDLDGTNKFNGTASGNLPLTGGMIKDTSRTPLRVSNATSNKAAIAYFYDDTLLGEIGVNIDKPFFRKDGVENDILHTGNISTNSNILATSSKHGTMSSNDKAKLDSIGGTVTIQKSLAITTEWMDTGITGPDLSTGSYVIQIGGMDSSITRFYQEIWTGFMSWFSGATNSRSHDEIILHKAGHADNDMTIYLRTIRIDGNTEGGAYLKLQICASENIATTPITFKFRKLI